MCTIASATGNMILPTAATAPLAPQLFVDSPGLPSAPKPQQLPPLVVTGKDWPWLPFLLFGALLFFAASE